MESGSDIVLPLLRFKNLSEIALGPVVFRQGSKGVDCLLVGDIPDSEKESLILQSLYLLYFSTNSHKMFYGEARDPIGSYFKTSPTSREMVVEVDAKDIDLDLVSALSKLIADKSEKDLENNRKLIQAIYYLLERDFGHHEHWETPLWNHYLLLGLSFEVLFQLNPLSPQSTLRQILRPLLHLKFSRPVELLWKWVDLFYAARSAYLLGKHPQESDFTENNNVKSPLHLIGEKLLIFSIYDLLFQQHFLQGRPGTPKTPDNFSKIHPDRVLIYFWPEELIDKKITLLASLGSEEELNMLHSIKALHKKLQAETGSASPESFFP